MRHVIRFSVSLAIVIAALSSSRAAVSIYVSPERLAERSPVIVEGAVADVASGLDPESGSLATYVTLDVETVYRGPDDLERVVLREPGGRWGDLIHDVDAVPAYEAGERVFVFLEPSSDGALHTTEMFFGKYRVLRPQRGPDRAVRDLSGQGRIVGVRQSSDPEEIRASHLAALAATVPLRHGANPRARGPLSQRTPASDDPWLAEPPELGRVQWDPGPVGYHDTMTAVGGGSTLAPSPGPLDPVPRFVALDSGMPARWNESDSSTAVAVDIERARDPLGDPAAAVSEIERALEAWTDVPEARIALSPGNTDAHFTASNASPAKSYPPTNVVLFGDPYGDISDPTGCSGVLAIGGYWRYSSPATVVNGQTFYPARRMYVIFNNGFECFLGQPDNLAEVATHELGHGLGFGHSTVADAIMRSTAYGGRGPRLGDDDRDAVHCTYPHTLTLTSPNGGESWQAGSVHDILWTVTQETGPDAGVVDLELSADGGSSWSTIRSGETNDGAYAWTVPDQPGNAARVRVVRPNRVSPTPAPFPAACSGDVSNGDFTITPPAVVAGSVPDGSGGDEPLRLERAGDAVLLTWGASCSAEAEDYAVYEGSLDALRSGVWEASSATCSAGADLSEVVAPGPGARYFLVTPRAGSVEGDLGVSSSGAPRPASATACAPRQSGSC